MSHYCVYVLVPGSVEADHLDRHVHDVMERYWEDREVPRYKDQILDDEPRELWLYDHVVRTLGLGEEEAARVGSDWAAFVEVFARFRSGLPEEEYAEMGLDEDGKPFEWSTRNPEAKWDWFQFGGRWSDWFTAKAYAVDVDIAHTTFVRPDRRRGGASEIVPTVARLRAIDFEAMAAAGEEKHGGEWEVYQSFVREHGQHRTWHELYKDLGDRKQVAEAYYEQPAVKAGQARQEREMEAQMNLDDEHRDFESVFYFDHDAFDEATKVDEATWRRWMREAAVATYALVDIDGEWRAPSRMGWWAMEVDVTGDRREFNAEVARQLRELPQDTWVALLDCHI